MGNRIFYINEMGFTSVDILNRVAIGIEYRRCENDTAMLTVEFEGNKVSTYKGDTLAEALDTAAQSIVDRGLIV